MSTQRIIKENAVLIIETQIHNEIKNLRALNGKRVFPQDLDKLFARFELLTVVLETYKVSPLETMRFERAHKAIRKLFKAVTTYGSIIVEVEMNSLQGLGKISESELKELKKRMEQAKKVFDETDLLSPEIGQVERNYRTLKLQYEQALEKAEGKEKVNPSKATGEALANEMNKLINQQNKPLPKEVKTGIERIVQLYSDVQTKQKTARQANGELKQAKALLELALEKSKMKGGVKGLGRISDPYSHAISKANELKNLINQEKGFKNKPLTIQALKEYIDIFNRARFEYVEDNNDDPVYFKDLIAVLKFRVKDLKDKNKDSIPVSDIDTAGRKMLVTRIDDAIIYFNAGVKNRPKDKPPKNKTYQQDTTNCFARLIGMDTIWTDPQRFQNRNTAFSEQSADAVAKNFDPNQFDPITVWFDPIAEKTFVLSGHSRFEGMKRRGEMFIPAKFFEGSEADAIQFARVTANRGATKESFVEDLKAYKLMRDGDDKKGIAPASKKELKEAFKAETNKLEKVSHLSPKGNFVKALSMDDRSEFPFIERFSQWTGELKKELDFSDAKEDQIFNFVYSASTQAHKLDQDAFKKLVKERVQSGRDKIFDCDGFDCDEPKELEDFLKDKKEAELRKRLIEIDKTKNRIRARFSTGNEYEKIYTEQEKQVYRNIADELDREADAIKKQLNKKKEEGNALFGINDNFPKTVSGKGLVRILQHNNWQIVDQKGSHIHIESPTGRMVTVPNHKELRIGTYKSIQKEINNLGQL